MKRLQVSNLQPFASQSAEREGFEPPVRSPLRRISSAIHSTTLPSFLFHYDGAKVSKIIDTAKFFCNYFAQNLQCAYFQAVKKNIVELRGVEPRSERETTVLSTCLVFF